MTGPLLYVGDLRPGTTCRGRRDALRDLGYDVRDLDIGLGQDRRPHPPLWERVSFRLGYPADPTALNSRLLAAVVESRPGLVWVDAIRLVRRATLARMARLSPQSLRVAFMVDDAFPTLGGRGWRTFRRSVPLYDVVFVPRPESLEDMRRCGAARVARFEWGYDPHAHRPLGTTRDGWAGDVLFAGHWEPKRERDLAALVRAQAPVRIWGHQDWSRGRLWADIRTRFSPGGVYGDEYARAISAAKISLCFYSQWNRDVQNTRMYEIPACGGFMLAERTAENTGIFREGIEAEYFDTAEELIEKVSWFLQHDEEREQIARRGRERCVEAGFRYADRLAPLLLQMGVAPPLRSGVSC